VVTFLLARGGARDARRAALLARVRQLLGRRLGCVVADCGFTSRPALAALAAYGVPFGLGFARSRPVRARLDALSPQPRRWLRDGGAVRLGACPWDDRLRLVALGARSPTDTRGPSVYVTDLRAAGPQRLARTYRRRWRVEQALDEWSTATTSTTWSPTACTPTASPSASSWRVPSPSACRSPTPAAAPRPSANPPRSAPSTPTARRSWRSRPEPPWRPARLDQPPGPGGSFPLCADLPAVYVALHADDLASCMPPVPGGGRVTARPGRPPCRSLRSTHSRRSRAHVPTVRLP
jgi:hypothetical protein